MSIRTETLESLGILADKAALYTLKPAVDLVSQGGIIPISSLCDSAERMAKSAGDVANLFDILVDPSKTTLPKRGYCILGQRWDYGAISGQASWVRAFGYMVARLANTLRKQTNRW